MRRQFSPELEPYLAFHRGIGDENTINALQAGIDRALICKNLTCKDSHVCSTWLVKYVEKTD